MLTLIVSRTQDVNWHGLAKVRVLDGKEGHTFKSYLAAELVKEVSGEHSRLDNSTELVPEPRPPEPAQRRLRRRLSSLSREVLLEEMKNQRKQMRKQHAKSKEPKAEQIARILEYIDWRAVGSGLEMLQDDVAWEIEVRRPAVKLGRKTMPILDESAHQCPPVLPTRPDLHALLVQAPGASRCSS